MKRHSNGEAHAKRKKNGLRDERRKRRGVGRSRGTNGGGCISWKILLQ